MASGSPNPLPLYWSKAWRWHCSQPIGQRPVTWPQLQRGCSQSVLPAFPSLCAAGEQGVSEAGVEGGGGGELLSGLEKLL
jgi:hypothetical protein